MARWRRSEQPWQADVVARGEARDEAREEGLVKRASTTNTPPPPTSIATAPSTATGKADAALFANGGTSTFQGVGTSAFAGLATAPGTALPTPTNALLSTTSASVSSETATASAASSGDQKSTSQKMTPYLIAAGSVGGFVVTILVIWLVLRCVKKSRAKRETERGEGKPSAKQVPAGDWNETMTFAAGSRTKEEALRAFDSSSSSGRSASPPGGLTGPSPLKLAESSFIGRERGDLVRATISRHPLATLDEHAFFRPSSEEMAPSIFSRRKSSHGRAGLGQPASNGASPRQMSSAESSLSSAFGEGAHPPAAVATRLSSMLPPLRTGRSRVQSSWKLSHLSSNPSNAPRTPPTSVRESMATSIGTRDSLARFRSVHGWVDYQQSQSSRRGSEYPDAIETFTFFDDEDEGAAVGRASHSTLSTIPPLGFSKAEDGTRAYGFPMPGPDDSRKTWITEREAQSVYGDMFGSEYDTTTITTPSASQRQSRHLDGFEAGGGGSRPDTVYRFYADDESARADNDDLDNATREASWIEPPVPPLSRLPSGSGAGLAVSGKPALGGGKKAGGGPGHDIRRMDSTSTATVFRYHPGDEVPLARHQRVSSVELDQKLGRMGRNAVDRR